MCNIFNCGPEGHLTSTALEIIHCKDKLKMRLLLHRCKKAAPRTEGFFYVNLGSIDDGGDAHSELVTLGKQSIASYPGEI